MPVSAAVAPLGTALTEEQTAELWRLSPAPVLCFDGDAAGRRAARRAAELALPMLAPDRTLKFVALPEKEDPDSLLRREGSAAFRSRLDGAQNLAGALYGLLHDGIDDRSPEQLASFLTRLDEAARKIPDKALAQTTRDALRTRFYEARRARFQRPKSTTWNGRSAASPAIGPDLGIPRPPTGPEMNTPERHRILTAILVRHPTLLRDVEHAYAGLDLDPALGELRDAITDWAMHAEVLDSQALMDHLEGFGLRDTVKRILAGTPVPLPECASSAAMPAEAEEGWWHIFGFLNVGRLREEINLAREDAARSLTEDTERRLVARTSALNRICTGEPDGADIAAA